MDAEQFAPAPDGICPHAPPILDGCLRFAANCFHQVPAKYDAFVVPTLADRPGNAAVRQANEFDLAAAFAEDDLAAVEARRSIRAEQQGITLGGLHGV